MPRKGITIDDVLRAMAEIEGRGNVPSVRLVRAELGTGSNAKILALMSEIRAGHGEGEAVLPPMPDDYREQVQQLASELWKCSFLSADKRKRELRKAVHGMGYQLDPIVEHLNAVSKQLSDFRMLVDDVADGHHGSALTSDENGVTK